MTVESLKALKFAFAVLTFGVLLTQPTNALAFTPTNSNQVCEWNWGVWTIPGGYIEDDPGNYNPSTYVLSKSATSAGADTWYTPSVAADTSHTLTGDQTPPTTNSGTDSERFYGNGYYQLAPGTTATIDLIDTGVVEGHAVAVFDSAGDLIGRFPSVADVNNGSFYIASVGSSTPVDSEAIELGTSWSDALSFTVPSDGNVFVHYIQSDENNRSRFIVDGIDGSACNLDLDGDGIIEGAGDTDGDGIPDFLDLDSDNDGISDSIEGHDADGDGVADVVPTGTDTDGDGLDDAFDPDNGGTPAPVQDTDGDGVPDYLDTASISNPDSDGDGIPDVTEGTGDADGDGLPDNLDDDGDNDGIPDQIDLDWDNDGITNALECPVPSAAIASGENTTSAFGAFTINGDDVLDFNVTGEFPLDQRNTTTGLQFIFQQDADPTHDLALTLEAPVSGTLKTLVVGPSRPGFGVGLQNAEKLITVTWAGGGAAIIRDPNNEITQVADTFNNGVPVFQPIADGAVVTSGVVIQIAPGVRLPDSEWDMTIDMSSVTSFPTTIDFKTDASIATTAIGFEGFAFAGVIACDTDADGIPDILDLDSDNDGITDLLESGADAAIVDTDGDGIYDVVTDVDGDGVPTGAAGGVTPVDSDGDDLADYLDVDSDNDGITDTVEAGGVDADGDGVVDGFTDADGDGLDDATATAPLPVADTDGDGLRDYLDLDSDGDGILDAIEGHDDDGDGVADVLPTGIDTDEDGIDDAFDPDNGGTPAGVQDTDGDGVADHLDLDSDNDGILDTDENVGDTDGDGTPDYLDLDSDGDGINDALEGNDANGDGFADVAPTGLDTDGGYRQ